MSSRSGIYSLSLFPSAFARKTSWARAEISPAAAVSRAGSSIPSSRSRAWNSSAFFTMAEVAPAQLLRQAGGDLHHPGQAGFRQIPDTVRVRAALRQHEFGQDIFPEMGPEKGFLRLSAFPDQPRLLRRGGEKAQQLASDPISFLRAQRALRASIPSTSARAMSSLV